MAIQMRRGGYGKFAPSKLLPGEWAVVQEDDVSVRDGKAVYIAFSAGDTKRMATYEDMADDLRTAFLEAGGGPVAFEVSLDDGCCYAVYGDYARAVTFMLDGADMALTIN